MNQVNTTMTVKRINTELVRATLKRLKSATKPEVAKATGLSVMT
ncbi:ROK family protein, partial [Turicibacter sanguinis]|nr:ROK family protein [Turicibacter sanguinis]